MNIPTPKQIKTARQKYGLTQIDAGDLIYKALRTWQQWENGDRKMDPTLWDLFNTKAKKLNKGLARSSQKEGWQRFLF